MLKKQTGESGLLRHFDEARKSLRDFAIRVRSWGAWQNSPLVHDAGARAAKLLHAEQDDIDSRNSMLQSFAERVAVVSKGTKDPEQILAFKKATLDSYDVSVEELDAFAAETGVTGYPGYEH